MELILASASGADECVLNCEYDFELGGINTFELTVPYEDWTGAMSYGKRVYSVGSECGGIIKVIESDTSEEVVRVRGITWRGLLYKRVFKGTVSGELHTVIDSLIGEYGDVLVTSSKDTGITLPSTTFDCITVGEAIDTILKNYRYKLSMKYVQTENYGYMAVEAVPAKTFSDEVSQDALLNFIITDDRSWVNHVICVKDGSVVAHLYADLNGNISTTQSFFGIDEIQEFYEYDNTDIVERAKEHFAELINRYELSISLADEAELGLTIGDYVTGRDFITGLVATRQITSMIIKLQDNSETIEYLVEE